MLQAGWNFIFPGAVFRPKAAIGLTAAHIQQLALGFDKETPSGPELTFATKRQAPHAGTPEDQDLRSRAVQFLAS